MTRFKKGQKIAIISGLYYGCNGIIEGRVKRRNTKKGEFKGQYRIQLISRPAAGIISTSDKRIVLA